MTDRLVTGAECDILVSKLLGFETFPCFFMVSVSKNFGIDKSIGIGFENVWHRKKYLYQFRKKLVLKKVSDLVSGTNWYRKKYRIRYQKKLVSEKSVGFGFVQILGFVTHCRTVAHLSSRFLSTVNLSFNTNFPLTNRQHFKKNKALL